MSRRRALVCGVFLVLLLLGLDGLVVCSTANLESLLARTLRGTFGDDISMGALEGSALEGFQLRDVRVAGADGRPDFLHVKLLRAEVSLLNPVFGRPVLRQVTLEGVACTLSFAPDGTLELPAALKGSEVGAEPPTLPGLAVRGLTVHVLDAPHVLRNDVSIPFEDLAFDLAPRADAAGVYSFRCGVERSLLGKLHADGSIGRGTFSVSVTRDGLAVDPSLAALLAPDLAALVEQVQLAGGGTLTASLRAATSLAGEPVVTLAAGALLDGASARVNAWPLAIEGLSGAIRYERGVLVVGPVVPLAGSFAGAAFSASGSVGLDGDVPHVNLAGRIAGIDLSDAFVENIRAMPDPGPEIARQLSVFRVRGKLDMNWRLANRPGSREAGVLALEPDLDLALSAGEFRYAGHFDYLLRNFGGNLHVTDVGLEAQRLEANEAAMRFAAGVRVDYRRKGEEHYSVRAEAEHLPVDERLLRVLDPATRSTLADLKAEGSIRLVVRADRPPGMREDPPVDVEVGLEGIVLEPVFMPWRLFNVTGTVRPHGEVVQLDGVRGERDGGTLFLDGRVGLGESAGLLDLEVRGAGILIDEHFTRALEVLAPGAGAALATLDLRGRMDCTLRVVGPGGGVAPTIIGDIALRGASIEPRGTGLRLAGLTGHVALSDQPGRRELSLQPGFSATFEGQPLIVSGACSFGGAWHFELAADAFRVDAAVLRALEGVVPSFRSEALRPRVEGTFAPKLSLVSRGEGVSWHLGGTFKDARCALPSWEEVELGACRGTLVADKAGLRVASLTAEYVMAGAGAALLSAEELVIPATDEPLLLREVKLVKLPLAATLGGFLGKSAEAALASWPAGLTGVLSATLPKVVLGKGLVRFEAGALTVQDLAHGEEQTFCADEVRLVRAALEWREEAAAFHAELAGRGARLLRLPIPEFAGELKGDARGFCIEGLSGVLIGRGTQKLAGASLNDLRAHALELGLLDDPDTLALEEVALRLKVLEAEERLEGRLDHAGLVARVVQRGLVQQKPAEALAVAELRALLARGRDARPFGVLAQPGSRFEVAFEGAFKTALRLRDVSVAEAIATLGGAPGEVRGRMQADLALEGRLADSATWVGAGSLQSEVWNAIQLPFMLGVLKAMDVTALFSDQRRAQIVAGFTIGARSLCFMNGFLKSPGLRLEIRPPGRIEFEGGVDLDFDVSHGGGVPVISDILGFLPSLLLDRLRVRGTLGEPEIEGGR